MNTDLPSDAGLLLSLRRLSQWLAIVVALYSLLVLVMWQLGRGGFMQSSPDTPVMAPLTALSFLLLCVGILSMGEGAVLPGRAATGRILAVAVLLMVSIRLLPILPALSFGTASIALSTAISLILQALALWLLPAKSGRAHQLMQVMAVAALLPAFFSLLGYLYRVTEFYGVFRHIPMVMSSAVCAVLLSMALLFARPGAGIMRTLTSSLSGGIHARLFIPVAILAPVTLGLLRLYGYWAGLFSTEFGVTILVLSIILVFIWTIWYTAKLLIRRELQIYRMAANLAASESRLQLLVNSAQDYAIFMLDGSGCIASWNKGAERIKGFTAAEAIGQPVSIFYTPEDIGKGEPLHHLAMAKAQGQYTSEGWRIRKDGTRFWADTVLTAVYDEEGQLKGYTKITRDRTEYKKAHEQIAYQARLMENTSDAIISMDQQYRIVSWNKGAASLYGYQSGEAIGQPVANVVRTTSTQAQQSAIREVLLQEGHWTGEVVHRQRDGNHIHLLMSISETRDIQGRVDGYVVVGRDISARKAEEDQLRQFNQALEEQVRQKTAELTTVFERMSDGIMAFDRTGLMTYVNQQAAKMNKCRPEELMGVNFWQRFPSAVHNEFRENFNKAMETQQNVHFEMFSPSLQMWIECFMYPSPDGLSLFFRDISGSREAQDAIKKTSEELRQLASHLQDIREEERATIAREIHDELGQQLTGIKMDMSWIAKKWGNGPDDVLVQKIRGTLGLLDGTINTVRRIATDLRPSILDDLGLVAAIEWQCQEFTRRSAIGCSFRSSINEFHCESSMAIGLFRICQESLTNVARHAGAKHVRIDLELTGPRLVLRISDDGRGMNLANRQGKKTLGLLGMRERAVMMGGELDIRNAEDGGLTLEVSVPLKESSV